MANFFKKLTGSFRMQGEDELPLDGEEKDTHKEEEGVESQDGGEVGHDEPEIHAEPEEVEEERPQTSEPTEPEDGDSEAQSPESEVEQPYTIAELARASTSAKKLGLKGRLHVFSYGKEGREEDGGEVSSPSTPEGQLAIDVYETPSEIVIKSTIAGVKAEDLDIGIEENTVNIRGARHNEEKAKGEDYFYQECYWGTFSRSIILPIEVDNENASAALEDGILTIRLPKIQKAKEMKIKVVKG
jgi:HSP20 family protein